METTIVRDEKKLLRLEDEAVKALHYEFQCIPDKYQKFFNSTHEGYGVLMEEVKELEDEIFFGEKRAKAEVAVSDTPANEKKAVASKLYRQRIRTEAIQVAAMAIRIAQELTK